jgi:diguanylate cyclase (GGDEF)-like protein/PAS domain S-box-containing protein
MSQSNINLLVASHAEHAAAISHALQSHPLEITIHCVDTLAELQQALDTQEWHLIFSDLELQDFTALDLIQQLSNRDLEPPVVLITETGVEEIALRCLEAGADQHIHCDEQFLMRLPALIDVLLKRAQQAKNRRLLEEEVRKSKEHYQDIFENTSDLIQCLGPDGSFLYTNNAWQIAMGYSEAEISSLSLMDVLHPDSALCCRDRFERLKQGHNLSSIDFKFVTKSGDTIHLAGECGSVLRDGEAISTRGIFKNVTETVKAETALRASETRYQMLYENAPDIYTTIDAKGEILSINQTGAHMLGYEASELIGTSATNVIHPDDLPAVFAHIEQQFSATGPDKGIEYRKIAKDGSIIWVHQRVTPEPGAEEPRMLVVCRDVTERRSLEQQLVHQATHDDLTKLINRREFEIRLRHMLSVDSDNKHNHVLCYLDLDQFKVINDTCGHVAGDELLRQVAGLLAQQVRSCDTLARLGGDEFAVLMEDCPIDKAEYLANRLRETIEAFRFQWHSRRFAIGVSIGVVPIKSQHTIEEALSLADSACYAAKDQGRNRIHVCHDGDHTVAGRVGDMQWASSITEAIEADKFRLYAQPIFDCCSAAKGDRYEILLRLQDGEEAIRPGAFMSAAERYNLSTKIDYWVLDNLIEWFEEHPGALESLDLCSVNLSALSLCDDAFRQYAYKRMQSSQFPPHKLCFEITETAAISNLAQAIEFIDTFHQAGCHFSLDDFGSGLSSFAYLKNLPVEMIKIDGTFIRSIADSEIDRTMVKSICDIVSKMGKQTTAEYVESAEALDILKSIGVDFAQGYYLGEPVPLEVLALTGNSKTCNVISIKR